MTVAREEPEPVDVTVLNARFLEKRESKKDPEKVAVPQWSGDRAYLVPPAKNGRTDKSWAATPVKKMYQRLRGVRAGAKVTVTFDDSPSTANSCKATAATVGQSYTVEGSGEAGKHSYTTEAPPAGRKPSQWAEEGNWRTRTYEFTAKEDEPALTFVSETTSSDQTCGAMLTNIHIRQAPPPADKTRPKTNLPWAEAFKGNDPSDVKSAVEECDGKLDDCPFEVDKRYSYAYYDKARVIGEAYVNCTRNQIQHTRWFNYRERSFDSLAPTHAKEGLNLGSSAKLPTSGDPTLDDDAQSRVIARQIATGYERAYQVPWQWRTHSQRKITEIIEAGEVGWIEVQPGRQRVEGWLNQVGKYEDDAYRLYVTVDGPSLQVPDRIYQRTGPMSKDEKSRCKSDRPMASTPVDSDQPAASVAKATVPADPPPSGGTG